MPVNDVFSKRDLRARGELPDVYQYDKAPEPLRCQIIHVIRDIVGNPAAFNSPTMGIYAKVHKSLCREYGVFRLTKKCEQRDCTLIEEVYDFIMTEPLAERVLDAVELLLKGVRAISGRSGRIHDAEPVMTVDRAVEELNARFREHGFGFQVENGVVVRVDSQVIHQSAVRPALHLLGEARYSGANEEFLRAHEHYRHGRHPEAVVDSLKSLESVLKVICDKRGWAFGKGDAAKALLDNVFRNSLIPSHLESHFSSLRASLENGVPTIRNKHGGHGQGAVPVPVPQHLVEYQLHLAASAIVFLVESEKAMP